ncbi:helix-turn-helix domain-containing protein [Streptomyces albidoflavus]
MSARDALNAYVAHFSDADQAEYEKRLDAYANEIRADALREAVSSLLALPVMHTPSETAKATPMDKRNAMICTPDAWANLGLVLRQKREEQGYSRRALSELADVSEKSIQLVEEGRVPAKRWPQSLDRIAVALGWTTTGVVDFLMAEPPF